MSKNNIGTFFRLSFYSFFIYVQWIQGHFFFTYFWYFNNKSLFLLEDTNLRSNCQRILNIISCIILFLFTWQVNFCFEWPDKRHVVYNKRIILLKRNDYCTFIATRTRFCYWLTYACDSSKLKIKRCQLLIFSWINI